VSNFPSHYPLNSDKKMSCLPILKLCFTYPTTTNLKNRKREMSTKKYFEILTYNTPHWLLLPVTVFNHFSLELKKMMLLFLILVNIYVSHMSHFERIGIKIDFSLNIRKNYLKFHLGRIFSFSSP